MYSINDICDKQYSLKDEKHYTACLYGKNKTLNIPVFIVAINKTESNDIVAFDNNYSELMPHSGTFINVGFNKFLLFNNTRYNGSPVSKSDGFPFPIKIGITCNQPDLAKDIKIIRELIDQVYQFSRMYWKSVRQQNLPVTIKYPEMVAEMVPHFEGNEIPDFEKARVNTIKSAHNKVAENAKHTEFKVNMLIYIDSILAANTFLFTQSLSESLYAIRL